ncbi:MAG: FAD-dependent oxidoreductase [Pseudomonadota bacterium]
MAKDRVAACLPGGYLSGMNMIETDILVAGGGIAGLTAAARLASEGLDVTCVDPRPAGGGEGHAADERTTAFLMPAIETFRHAGAYAAMQRVAEPLWTMRIVNVSGSPLRVRSEGRFEARELGEAPFGYNIPNEVARKALAAVLERGERARFIGGTGVAAATRQGAGVTALLSDGTRVTARLLVAADGRDSPLAKSAGIAARRWRHDQRALVLTVSHAEPHEGVSTEMHRPGGPLVLVPLPDRDGRHRSAVVWLDTPTRMDRLLSLDDAALGTELTADTLGLFGPLTLEGPRASWPIVSQLALRFHARRMALVGEPAHVVPPTGAQGANMGVADAEALARLVAEAKEQGRDIGADSLLARYSRTRLPEVTARVLGVSALNGVVRSPLAPVQALRRLGLGATTGLAPVRRFVMRAGMGAG